MDYWSILISALIGALGGGVSFLFLSKVSQSKLFLTVTTTAMALIAYLLLKPIIYDDYIKNLMLKSEINKALKDVEEAHLPLLPRIADLGIRQDNIKAGDLRLTFEYTILDKNIDKNKFENTFAVRAKEVKADACVDAVYQELTRNGVVFEYLYRLENSPHTKSFEVKSCD
jgi:hypothetical protein